MTTIERITPPKLGAGRRWLKVGLLSYSLVALLLTAGCAEDASTNADSSPSPIPSRSETRTLPQPSPSSLPTSVSSSPSPATVPWTTKSLDFSNSDGYTATVEVSLGHLQKAVSGTQNGRLALGSGCNWNFGVDGAIMFSISLTNTTPAWTVDAGLRFTVDDYSNVQAELYYSSGATCRSDLWSIASTPGVTWSDLRPSAKATFYGILRIPSAVTPNFPNGDPAKLSDWKLNVGGVTLGGTGLNADGNSFISIPLASDRRS